MTTKRITISDVAKAAGVSITTVSFVLNDNSKVSLSQETRRRVIAVAAELGYRQNSAAQSLASNRTHLLGLITDAVTTPFAGDSIRGAQSRAWESEYQLLITSVEPDETLNESAFELLLQRQVEGLIFVSATHRVVALPAVASEVPAVLVNAVDVAGRIPHVIPDEILGGATATQALLDAGHRRIALLNLEAHTVAAHGRKIGYEQALAAAGVAFDPTLVVSTDATARGGYAAAKELLGMANPPTGLFCATDRIAMGAYDAIKEAGLALPSDVSVVGFDDMQIITEYLHPRLTSVALPFFDMADTAVDMLVKARDENAPLESRVLGTPLVVRDSIAQVVPTT